MPHNPQIHLVSRPTGEPSADNFKLLSLDTPALQDKQVLVKHEFLSLDPYMRGRMNDGKSYTTPQALNAVMVGGTVGEVVESRHPQFAVGDKVVGSGWGNMFATHVNLPADSVRKMPEGLSFEEASVFPVSYTTAWHALVDRGRMQAGETLLVLGAGGATGYAAVQIGKFLGAKVIASASSEDKRALALAGGADAAVDARAADWRDQVKAANDGTGVDVVFDPVGGEATEPAFRSLGWNGRHLIVGFPGGIAALRTNLPLLKGGSLIGVDIRQFGIFEPEKSAANRDAVFALADKGTLKPVVAKAYPIESFREAMADAASGKRAGRIVLTMD